MSYRFRHATCNEIFEKRDFAESCRYIKQCGYEGIEIAHFTLADDPVSIAPGQRAEYRRIIRDEGLQFVGLHWLMVAPAGLHVSTPDAELRARGWRHIQNLIDLCADLGADGTGDNLVMVFGSPKQRGLTGGATREEATRNYIDGLRSVAAHAEQRQVRILVEALPSTQTEVILSLDEAAAIVHEIGSPAIQTMFDTHNAVEETEPHEVLVERHFPVIKHVHVNEMDGGHCGTGGYDFKPVLRKLRELDYSGWISLEAFDFRPGAERIAKESIDYLNQQIELLG